MEIPRAPKSELDKVLGPVSARLSYEDGSRRWRKPHHGRRVAPSGIDTDSMDYRGVRTAFNVTSTLPPREVGTDGEDLPRDPEATRQHYLLGLAAVQEAGLLPLDDRFVAGYMRWADATVRDEIWFAKTGMDTPIPDMVPETE
jgi:hypothetical protein